MPLIPTDPNSWSPDMYRLFSYFVGLSRSVISRSVFDYGFAVASSVAVVYDWGEQDVLWKKLLMSLWFSPVLTFGQEVG
jgi:hypothetical protein